MTDTINSKTDQYLILILNDREAHDFVYERLKNANNAAAARVIMKRTIARFNITKDVPEWCLPEVLYPNNLATVLYEYMYEPDDSFLYEDLMRVEGNRKEEEQGGIKEPKRPSRDDMMDALALARGFYESSIEAGEHQGKIIINPKVLKQYQEQQDMTTTYIPKFETKNLVDGQDITEFSDDELINMVDRCKKNVKRLQEVGVESKGISKKVEELEASIKKLVEVLDSRA